MRPGAASLFPVATSKVPQSTLKKTGPYRRVQAAASTRDLGTGRRGREEPKPPAVTAHARDPRPRSPWPPPRPPPSSQGPRPCCVHEPAPRTPVPKSHTHRRLRSFPRPSPRTRTARPGTCAWRTRRRRRWPACCPGAGSPSARTGRSSWSLRRWGGHELRPAPGLEARGSPPPRRPLGGSRPDQAHGPGSRAACRGAVRGLRLAEQNAVAHVHASHTRVPSSQAGHGSRARSDTPDPESEGQRCTLVPRLAFYGLLTPFSQYSHTHTHTRTRALTGPHVQGTPLNTRHSNGGCSRRSARSRRQADLGGATGAGRGSRGRPGLPPLSRK